MTTESLRTYPNVDDWIVFEKDGRLRVRTGKVDIGQRITTALGLIAAEELDLAFERIDVDRVDTESSLDEEYSSASNSMERSGQSIRLAAATARRAILSQAADALSADVASLDVNDGLIVARLTNRSITYWDLMLGKAFKIPVDLGIVPKASEAYRTIGKVTVVPVDLPELVSGTAPFVHDMQMPGMLHARLVRPPNYHARLARLPADMERSLGSARLVRNGSFLAVAAEREYEAVRAAARVARAVQWTSDRGLEASRSVYDLLVTWPSIDMPVRNGEALFEPAPPLAAPPDEAVATFYTRLTRPYTMHASIGPSAGLAFFDDPLLTIWTHTQGVFPLRRTIAETLAMDVEHVRLIQQRGPGAYGHNGADDAALDAALISLKIPGKPILLKYSREDEHAWEPYGPAMVVDVRASLDAAGNIIDWSHDSWSDTQRTRPRLTPNRGGPGRMISTRFLETPVEPHVAEVAPSASAAGVHRNADPYYGFKRRRVVKHLVRDMPLRTSTLRSLGSFLNVIGTETMMDELAIAAGVDPVEFRLRNLTDERAKAVIAAVAEHADWSHRKSGSGLGRGLAFARYNGLKAYAAVIVDLSLDKSDQIQLEKITVAADAGQIVDPDGLRLQLEGAILQGASWMLYEEVKYDSMGITSRDWDGYPIMRFDNVPDVESILIDRPGQPYLGPSECAISPTGAAIAIAFHDLTGLRLRRLPFTPEAVREAALQA